MAVDNTTKVTSKDAADAKLASHDGKNKDATESSYKKDIHASK
jgi:hypothetical protein